MKMRDHLARSLAGIAGDNFADGKDYWLKAADTAIRIVRHHDALADAGIPVASADTRRDGEDATKIAAEFTSGAVPHEDEADAQTTPPSQPRERK